MNKKLVLIGAGLALVLGMLFLSGTASANVSGGLCGESGVWGAGGGLRIKKDVFCEKDTNWNWKILKVVDQPSLLLAPGQSHTVNYTVTASAQEDSTYRVSGRIAFTNSSSAPITIGSVTDTLGEVTCQGVTFPYELPARASLTCTYEGELKEAPAQNTATVTDVNGTQVTAFAAIDWSKATGSEVDECVMVSDTFAGDLGTVCANGAASFKFEYARTIGPFDACTETTVDNTASFVTNDTGAGGESSAAVSVSVPCAGACTLTPGYWKTHSAFGPAPYDSTWALLGENSPFFFSGKSYYDALWTAPQGNAYYILAHAYIAAQLNQLNGADLSAVQAQFDAATALFSSPANTPAAVGALRGAAKSTWTNLASALDAYNNGLSGPGHCSE